MFGLIRLWPNLEKFYTVRIFPIIVIPEGCSCKFIEDRGRAVGVIALIIARRKKAQAKAIKHMTSKHTRKKFYE